LERSFDRPTTLVLGLVTLLAVAGCDAGLKSEPDPSHQFQPLQINVAPAVVNFYAPVGGPNPGSRTVDVQNAGPGTVTGLGVGTTQYEPVVGGWLSASLSGATFAPATLTLSVDVAGMGPGLYFAIVPVVSTVTGVLERDVVVTLTVTPAPIIRVSPDTVAMSATAGGTDPSPQTALITNAGTASITGMSVGTISYGPGASGWLNGSLNQPTDPATLTLQASTGSLAAGTYLAKVPVISNVAGIVHDTLDVEFTVTSTPAPPVLAISPTTVSFSAPAGNANPANKTISIANGGAGTVSSLAIGAVQYSPSGVNWLTKSLSQATAPATLTVGANIAGLAPGNYLARFPVTAAAGTQGSPKNITVDLTITGVPALVVSPLSASFAGTLGQPPPLPQSMSVTNGGPGVLSGLAVSPVSYGAGQPTGWLNTTLSSTTTPASIVLTADPTGLPSGTFTATVQVSSTDPGISPQTISATFDLAGARGFFNILQGDGQTGLVDSVLSEDLVARVTDASFNPVPGATVTWQVNNGGTLTNVTSVSNGLGEVDATWRLGHIAGIQTVRVSSAGLPTLTFTADAQLPPSGGNQHPHEPAGYVAFAEHNMSSLPSYPRTLGGLLGSWYGYPQNDPDLVVVQPDTSAPESPPNTIRTRFPRGLQAGSGPVNFGGWDAAGRTNGQKSKLYISLWLKLDGPNYENQATGTKMGFIGGATPTSSSAHNSWFFLKGNGSQAILPTFKVELHQSFDATQNPPSVAINLPQNVDTRSLMTAGVWHHWEAVFEMNTPGVEFPGDGIFKWWIDGILVMDFNNMTYRYGTHQNRFWDFVWNPTWGGTAGVKTRDDFILMDHLYMSGVP
jgi:hypothetical protein